LPETFVAGTIVGIVAQDPPAGADAAPLVRHHVSSTSRFALAFNTLIIVVTRRFSCAYPVVTRASGCALALGRLWAG
jgi:hypothetical protein